MEVDPRTSRKRLEATDGVTGKAKEKPDYRFYLPYDKVYREDVLAYAYQRCKANKGAPGIDGQDFADVEAYGEERWLDELADTLRRKTYRPEAVPRVWIPKANGKLRPLGIPRLADRVVMVATTVVLEAIFEVDMPAEQYGYRPNLGAQTAVKEISRLINRGHTRIVDGDLADYLDDDSYYTSCVEVRSKRLRIGCITLRRKPFLRPRLTWMAFISPRLTRCHTVCLETRNSRIV